MKNQDLKIIQAFLEKNGTAAPEEKAVLLKALKNVADELNILAFKLDRTEKVKRTTAILLEETIAELEKKREAVEIQARLIEAENERKSQELEEARQLQLAMLPKELPRLPGLQIAAYMQTATEVGGDYYDFHLAKDGTLTAAIGDATGHGLKAGIMVAATKGLFNSLAQEPEPNQILAKSSAALRAMGFKRLYMAMTIAKFTRHRLKISAAGMPFALLYRSRSACVEEVALNGMPLGSFAHFPYQQREIYLEPGDTMLMLSDGLGEMLNEEGNMLGDERVKQVFAESGRQPPQQIIDHLKCTGESWAGARTPDDDVTLVVLRAK